MNRKLGTVILMLVSSAAWAPVSANNLATAQDLADACRIANTMAERKAPLSDEEAIKAISCLGFLTGFAGAVNAVGNYEIGGMKVCANPSLTDKELAVAVVTSFDTYRDAFKPKEMDDSRILALWAMKELHDCGK